MATIFLAMFVFGLGFLVLSFVMGFADLDIPIPGLEDAGLDLGDADSGAGASWLNVSTVMAFITWTGGVGYLVVALTGVSQLVAIALSLLGGLAGGALVFFLMARVLWPGQTAVMRQEDFRIEGSLARVSLPMSGARIGEVVFTKGGTTRSEGARSVDGSPLTRGQEVVILRYERGIAYVEPLDKLLAERDTARSTLPAGEAVDARQARLPDTPPVDSPGAR